ncbi:PREDICTED: uncharacterized protein LOC109158402 [Ipomoea nil]|uniref:uncharacterized protein LOC109158402 n=1 Tax=Ipomoea nil TaxID=35883 RepID=UPI0009018EC8|nr:PREDICTED: uncharacterized protein LOC109158402 [Ipomoea nil]
MINVWFMLIEKTGGLVVLAESFGHPVFKDSFKRVFDNGEKSLGLSFNGRIEINCSKDIKVQGIIWPCTTLEKKGPAIANTVIGEGNTIAWKICGLDKTTCFTIFFDISSSEKSDPSGGTNSQLCIQFLTSFGLQLFKFSVIDIFYFLFMYQFSALPIYAERFCRMQLTSSSLAETFIPLFPKCCFDQETAAVDMAEWEEDPDEYIRKNLPSELEEISGWREDLFTARKSALNLLGVISMSKGPPVVNSSHSSKRKKGEKSKKTTRRSIGELLVLPFLSKFPIPSDANIKIVNEYYGVLMAYSSLLDFLKEQKPGYTATLLQTRLLPLYRAPLPEPHLIASANWVLGELASCLPEEMSADIYSALMEAFITPDRDISCYPVRVSAAGAIAQLVEKLLDHQQVQVLKCTVLLMGSLRADFKGVLLAPPNSAYQVQQHQSVPQMQIVPVNIRYSSQCYQSRVSLTSINDIYGNFKAILRLEGSYCSLYISELLIVLLNLFLIAYALD